MNSAPQQKHLNNVFNTPMLTPKPDILLFLQHRTDN
jgi:hypothetical protein